MRFDGTCARRMRSFLNDRGRIIKIDVNPIPWHWVGNLLEAGWICGTTIRILVDPIGLKGLGAVALAQDADSAEHTDIIFRPIDGQRAMFEGWPTVLRQAEALDAQKLA